MQIGERIGEGHGGTSGGRTVLSPDGDAAHLEGKLVAHYHSGPLGATTTWITSSYMQ